MTDLMNPIDQALERLLVLKCQLGDRGALEELFQRHNPRLGYYLRRLLDRDDAGDVQQEVWLTVIRQIGRLRSPAAFAVLLYRIARSKAYNQLAGQRRGGPPEQEAGAQEAGTDEEAEFSPADAARIHEGLKTLTPEHREVLVLRFMDDLSYEQIAEVVGCGVGTVRSRLHYAKRLLRRQLENQNE